MPSITLIASKAPKSFLFILVGASLHLHVDRLGVCVCKWWQGGGLGVKGLQWSWECGKPPLVQSNHSRLSIILPPPLPPSEPITPLSRLPPPSIIPTSLIRKLGWHSTALSPLTTSRSLPLLPPSSFPFLTHYSQFTGCYMEGDTGPIQSLVPVSHSAFWSAAASWLWASPPPAGCHSVFHTSHHLCPPLLHRTFYFLICHSCFPFTCLFFSPYLWLLKSCVSPGRCFRMALSLLCSCVTWTSCRKSQ